MRSIRISVFLAFAASAALPQFPIPGGGGYPGGGYPPGRYPPGQDPTNPRGTGGTSIPSIPRGKKKSAEDATPTASLRGLLRKYDDRELILETDDKRTVHVKHSSTTKYLEGAKILNPDDLQPGDHLFIEASQDDRGRLSAIRVTFEKGGTPSERAAARRPIGDDIKMSDDEPAPTPRSSDDPDRPRMKRAAGSSSGSATTESARSGSATSDDDGRPKLKRAPGSASDAPAKTVDSRKPKPAEDQEETVTNPTEVRSASTRDPDAPKLVRGKPAARKSSSDEVEIADARPIDRASAGQSVSGGRAAMEERGAANTQRTPESESDRPNQPNQPDREVDPFIEQAREMATTFVETLPNYVVKQLTTRFYSTSAKASWNPQDNIQTDLVYENGREQYRNILLNGKPPKGKIEETGSWSTGEFATVLQDLFSPATNADFRPRGTETIAHRTAKIYGFLVEQPNSHWQIIAEGQSYRPAYRGTVWIDKETARVLRIEMQARNMPKEFPIDTVESATDYDFVRIASGNFLLPTHSENLSCIRGSNQCSRNVIDFRNYRKFGAESDISFKPQ